MVASSQKRKPPSFGNGGLSAADAGGHKGGSVREFQQRASRLSVPNRHSASRDRIIVGLSSRARRRDRERPSPHRRDLQRVSLPRIDPASRCSPTWPLKDVRVATAVCYLQRDVFIERRGLDWIPPIIARWPHYQRSCRCRTIPALRHRAASTFRQLLLVVCRGLGAVTWRRSASGCTVGRPRIDLRYCGHRVRVDNHLTGLPLLLPPTMLVVADPKAAALKYRGKCPSDQTVGRVSKQHLVRVERCPLGAQAGRQTSSHCGGQYRSDSKVDAASNFERRP